MPTQLPGRRKSWKMAGQEVDWSKGLLVGDSPAIVDQWGISLSFNLRIARHGIKGLFLSPLDRLSLVLIESNRADQLKIRHV